MSNPREAELALAYDTARPRLTGVAYAVLGSYAEAEDVVADCWLRLVAADAREQVRDLDAWATVAVVRAAADTLRSARRRREVYTGPWLPEPVLTPLPADDARQDPADRVTLDDTVRYALLVLLESLSPAERTSWVLHDLFGMPFDEVAETVGRTPAAVRQLAARARQHIKSRAPRIDVSRDQHDAAVSGFIAAATQGDLGTLITALDPDVVLTSDGGGEVRAALRPVVGAENVGRFIEGVIGQLTPTQRIGPIRINGEVGVAIFEGDQITTAVAITFDGDAISRLDLIRAPHKLSAQRIPD